MLSWINWKNNIEQETKLGPVLIFHHIAKTAGTSLQKVVKSNYKRGELLDLYGPNKNSVEWYDNYYNSLSFKKKSSVKCISAHSAHYLIPIIDRPFRVFSLLRDPVDRVISLYYFMQILAKTGKGVGATVGREIERLDWTLEDIYLNVGVKGPASTEQHRLFAPFFNGQSRAILAPHLPTSDLPFSTEPTDTSESFETTLDDILNQYYVVGVTEYYQESLQHFAETFGWHRIFIEHKNKTQHRPRLSRMPDEIVALIRSFNQLDTRIHQRYLSHYTRDSSS